MANTIQTDKSVLNFISNMADYIKFHAFRDQLYSHAQFVSNNTDNRIIYFFISIQEAYCDTDTFGNNNTKQPEDALACKICS